VLNSLNVYENQRRGSRIDSSLGGSPKDESEFSSSEGGTNMTITIFGWALVALGVAVSLVPVLYGAHLAVMHERLRNASVTIIATTPNRADSCPNCGARGGGDQRDVRAADLYNVG
jgi:hypothetical protein